MLVVLSESIAFILPDVKLVNSANVACFNILDVRCICSLLHIENTLFSLLSIPPFIAMQALLDYERYKMHGIFPSPNASQTVPGEVLNSASQPGASQV